jgi:hypothetical protein
MVKYRYKRKGGIYTMSKKEIEALFTQYQGNFKLITLDELDNMKRLKKALALSLKVMKTVFCIDEKKAYAIVKIA